MWFKPVEKLGAFPCGSWWRRRDWLPAISQKPTVTWGIRLSVQEKRWQVFKHLKKVISSDILDLLIKDFSAAICNFDCKKLITRWQI